MFFLEDKDGNLVMEQLTAPQCHIKQEYTEKLSGKKYPKEIEYVLTQGEKKVVYTIEQKYELESRDAGSQMPALLLKLIERKGLHPSTTRNFANGKLEYFDGNKKIEREGTMIYEFVYMSTDYRTHMETR